MNHQSKLVILGTRAGQRGQTRQVLKRPVKRQLCALPANRYVRMSFIFGMIGGFAPIVLLPLIASLVAEPLFHMSWYISLSHLTPSILAMFIVRMDLLMLPSLLPSILGVLFALRAKRLGHLKGLVNPVDTPMIWTIPSYLFLIMWLSFFVLIEVVSVRP